MVYRWGAEEFDTIMGNFLITAKRVIECKAIITYNAIELEHLIKIKDLLIFTYLKEEPENYHNVLTKAGDNCVIFCFDQNHVEYIRKHYSNIISVIYIPFSIETEESWLMAATYMALEVQEQIAVKQGLASVLKLLIQKKLKDKDFQHIELWISKYKEQNPEDMDLISMETLYNLYINNLELALQFGLEGVKRYPCNGDMHYNLASVYEKQRNWYYALLNYEKARIIYSHIKDEKVEKLNLVSLIDRCKKEYEAIPKEKEYMPYDKNEFWTKNVFLFFSSHLEQVVGKYYWESDTKKRYIGVYRDLLLRRSSVPHFDLIHIKGEFLEVTEGTEYVIDSTNKEVLLPIAVENQGTIHEIWDQRKKYIINQKDNRHFNYYRLPAGAKIYSSMKAYYGNPIPLYQEKDKKKLVLNIFVDGLVQGILDGEKFQKNMPYTANFFDKGLICTNAYSTAEWTYPSLANYITGVDTIHHMLFHPILDSVIPKEYPTLAEYFHEKGYFTSTIGGNWRAVPSYGHARGYDQFIYQHECTGFKAEMAVGEIIDHIEAFKETNQFLWITIGDLHDIADEFDLPNSVQSNMKLEERVQEEQSKTSVKQKYSFLKESAYKRMAKRIDVLLNIIYQYLNENYKEEDIIVTLFADHGQGYLVPDGEHFMSEGRTNVAFMFRGAGVKKQKCDEIISTSDYIKIMCKLADIKMKEIKIDGVLPKIFGGEGREYALSESIHPNDPYYAAIYSEDIEFFFENPFPVQNDGRFYLKEYKAWITDKQGNIVNNQEIFNKYLNIIMEHIKPLLIYD